MAYYTLCIPETLPDTPDSLKNIAEQNGHIFEGSVMAGYWGDTRYTYLSQSVNVTVINLCDGGSGWLEFDVDIHYFEGCRDISQYERVHHRAEFTRDPVRNCFHFAPDETVWTTDN